MEQLYQTSRLLVKSVDTLFVRYLYHRIKWNGRMLGIVGPRGRKKGQRQIADVVEGYVVKDDIEVGYLNVVPLWNFGLCY